MNTDLEQKEPPAVTPAGSEATTYKVGDVVDVNGVECEITNVGRFGCAVRPTAWRRWSHG